MIKSMSVAPRRAMIFGPLTQVRRIKSVGSSARQADIASFIIQDEQEVCTVNSVEVRHSAITMQQDFDPLDC